MKFKKPTSKEVSASLPMVGGAVLGTMASGAIVNIAKPSDATKTDNTRIIQGGLAVAGAYGAMALQASDTGGYVLKGVLVGTAVKSAFDLISGMVADNATVTAAKTATTKTTAQKAILGAVGLGCPCSATLNRPRKRSTRLRLPSIMYNNANPKQLGSPEYNLTDNSNHLQNVMNHGSRHFVK